MDLPCPNILWDLTLLHYFKFIFRIFYTFTSNLQYYIYIEFWLFFLILSCINFTLILHQNFYVVAKQEPEKTWIAEWKNKKEILYRTLYESSFIIFDFLQLLK